MSRLAFFAFLFFFLTLAGFRVYLEKTKTGQVIPRNGEIKFEATIKKQPKISDSGQVIQVGDGRIYAELFPRYASGERIRVFGKVDEMGRIFYPEITSLDRGGWQFWGNLRSRISQNIDRLLPLREATLVKGTVLGVDDIGKDFREALIKTGTIHVVVVSGQNLSIAAGIFLSLSKYIGRRKSLVCAILAVLFYGALAGFEPPVLRASLIVLISSLAVYFGREATPLWSLFLAGLIIVLVWPGALFEVSFQLTFAATLGIMTLGKWLGGKGKEAGIVKGLGLGVNRPNTKPKNQTGFLTITRNLFVENAAVATSAYVFTMPIILFYFGRVSPMAPLVNVLVAEAVFPIMVLGFAVAFASLVFMPLAQIIAYFAYVPAWYFGEVVGLFGG